VLRSRALFKGKGSVVLIDESTFTQNTAFGSTLDVSNAAAVIIKFHGSESSAHIERTEFSSNLCSGNGGGLLVQFVNDRSRLNVTNCTFQSNVAANGAGLLVSAMVRFLV
jgi:hypothetical protein